MQSPPATRSSRNHRFRGRFEFTVSEIFRYSDPEARSSHRLREGRALVIKFSFASTLMFRSSVKFQFSNSPSQTLARLVRLTSDIISLAHDIRCFATFAMTSRKSKFRISDFRSYPPYPPLPRHPGRVGFWDAILDPPKPRFWGSENGVFFGPSVNQKRSFFEKSCKKMTPTGENRVFRAPI